MNFWSQVGKWEPGKTSEKDNSKSFSRENNCPRQQDRLDRAVEAVVASKMKQRVLTDGQMTPCNESLTQLEWGSKSCLRGAVRGEEELTLFRRE